MLSDDLLTAVAENRPTIQPSQDEPEQSRLKRHHVAAHGKLCREKKVLDQLEQEYYAQRSRYIEARKAYEQLDRELAESRKTILPPSGKQQKSRKKQDVADQVSQLAALIKNMSASEQEQFQNLLNKEKGEK